MTLQPYVRKEWEELLDFAGSLTEEASLGTECSRQAYWFFCCVSFWFSYAVRQGIDIEAIHACEYTMMTPFGFRQGDL